METIRRAVRSVATLPAWLRFVYLVALLWSFIHCYVTAYGDQVARDTAASVGVIGSVCILVTLHWAITRHIWEQVQQEGERLRRQYPTAASAEPVPPVHRAAQD